MPHSFYNFYNKPSQQHSPTTFSMSVLQPFQKLKENQYNHLSKMDPKKMHGPLFKKIPQVVLPFLFPSGIPGHSSLVKGAYVSHQGRTLEDLMTVLGGRFSRTNCPYCLQPTLLPHVSSGVRCFFWFLAFDWYFLIKLYILSGYFQGCFLDSKREILHPPPKKNAVTMPVAGNSSMLHLAPGIARPYCIDCAQHLPRFCQLNPKRCWIDTLFRKIFGTRNGRSGPGFFLFLPTN